MKRKHLIFGAKALVTGALIWWVLRPLDLNLVKARLASSSPGFLLLAVALLFLSVGLNARRWQLILRAAGQTAGFRRLLGHSLAGLFVNQALPSTLGGDGLRALMLYRDGIPAAPAIRSVLIDRLLGLAVLAALAVLGLPYVMAVRHLPSWPAWVLEGLLLGGFALGLSLLRLVAQRSGWLERLPFGGEIRALASDVFALLSRWRLAGESAIISVLVQLAGCTIAYILAQAIHAPLRFVDAVSLMPTVFLLTAIPISIAGWGVRESIMVVGLGSFGIAPSAALIVSVLFGLTQVVVGLSGGVVWLLTRRAAS